MNFQASFINSAFGRIYPVRKVVLLLCGLGIALQMGGCSTMDFYYQSVKGQLEIISKRDSIESLLENPEVPADLKQKLEEVKEIRQFASNVLLLPENESYTKYADLGRRYVVWNVFAAPKLSLEAKSWCFPVAGCVKYRGYFNKEDAEDFASELTAKGNDVYVGGVPAYSTLGWFDDPILNTVIHYKTVDLAALIFHELAHQLIYVKDDTVFNESFATTVELEGVRHWQGKHQQQNLAIDTEKIAGQRNQIIALLLDYRERLNKIYLSDKSDQRKLELKSRTLHSLDEEYQNIRKGSVTKFGFDRWFEQGINNAHLVSVSAYHQMVPGFQQILSEHRGDLQAFYHAVKQLSKKPKKDRDAVLNRSVVEK